MPVFASNSDIPKPGSQWLDAEVLPIRIALPMRAVPLLEWLSERWSLTMATIAADMLVSVTSGRYVLAQLIAHHLQPQQGTRGFDMAALNLQLLKPTVDLLERAVTPNETDLGRKCGLQVLSHLLGILNPQAVSISLPDPEGEKLRHDDMSLTVHLPEDFEAQVDELAEFHELTKSDVIRNCLLLHVYGRVRYELWTAEGSWRPKRKATNEIAIAYELGDIRFSPERPYFEEDEPTNDFPGQDIAARRSEFIRQHGKSGDGTRVHLPVLLKQRLQELADAHGIRLSEYCRRILVALV